MDEIEYKGYTIKIEQDETPESPREWDNLGKMICFHKRYDLGDKHNYNSDDFNSWEELSKQLEKDGAVIILPLFLYDHSGLRMKVGSFQGLLPEGHAEFDSGQVGFIYATREDIKKEYQVTKVPTGLKEKVTDRLQGEVATYDQYLTGDIWGYTIEGIEDVGGSCWGFYGAEDAIKEAKSIIDYQIQEDQKKREAKLKKYIKHNVPLEYRHV